MASANFSNTFGTFLKTFGQLSRGGDRSVMPDANAKDRMLEVVRKIAAHGKAMPVQDVIRLPGMDAATLIDVLAMGKQTGLLEGVDEQAEIRLTKLGEGIIS